MNSTKNNNHPQKSSATKKTNTLKRGTIPVGKIEKTEHTLLSIWEPFAGYGTRIEYKSWFVNNVGMQAEKMRAIMIKVLKRRKIPGLKIRQRSIAARKGVYQEIRRFWIIQLKQASIGLYITRTGRDIFISQTTYVKGALEKTKLLIFILRWLLLFIFGYISTFVAGYVYDIVELDASRFIQLILSSEIIQLLIVLVFIILVLQLALKTLKQTFSFLSDLLRYRDPFRSIRRKPTEFQYEDGILLDRAVQETILKAIDVLGLNPDLLQPASDRMKSKRII